MLVLTRKLEEAIMIGDQIEIRVLQVRGTGEGAVVRLGITAPRDVTVLRKEVYDEVVAANQAAADHSDISTELLQVLLQQTVEKPNK
jgi:carbon storage regulator